LLHYPKSMYIYSFEGGDGLAVNMSRQHLRAADSSPAPPAVWLVSDMACGVARQGFDPGLQVFLRECIPVAAQTRSCLQGWMRVWQPSTAPKWVSDCHSVGQHEQVE
jgi:hypothetical protein